MQNAEDNSLSGYTQYDAEAELLGALGLFKSMYIPHLWHEELQGREDSAKEEELRQELRQEMARLRLQQEARDILGLKQPDPPQTASIKVTHIDWEGRSTKFPLSYGPVLLKEDGDWKYHNTISIPSTRLNEIIRELDSIRERIYLNERMAVQTLGPLPCGTPMMAGQSSHSTA